MMKKFSSSTRGVTLLEVMLVLAIAGMIFVLAIRYYQAASSNQQANAVVEQIQAITATADSLAQASGSYESAKISNSTLSPLLPNNTHAFTTPWGTEIVLGEAKPNSYQVTIPDVPTGVCPLVVSKLSTNNHYSGLNDINCSATTTTEIKYTYLANP